MLTIEDDGLSAEWKGRVFINPPYGRSSVAFLKKLSEHGNGILLIGLRGDTHYFHDYVWGEAKAMVVIRRRIHFFYPDGTESPGDLGGATGIFAYGVRNIKTLRNVADLGYFTRLDHR